MKNLTQLFSFLLLFSLYPAAAAQNNNLNARTSFDIGVVLDLESPLGKMTKRCISMAVSDFYADHNHTTKLILHWRDSKQDIVDAASVGILLRPSQFTRTPEKLLSVLLLLESLMD